MTNFSAKLTSLSSKGGCGCKIGPADLAQVLHELPPGLSVAGEEAALLADELRENGVEAKVIGQVIGENKGHITVR